MSRFFATGSESESESSSSEEEQIPTKTTGITSYVIFNLYMYTTCTFYQNVYFAYQFYNTLFHFN